MMAFNHILVVIILIKVLHLDRNEAFVAILFGVLLDLDHLMGVPAYISEYGWAAVFNIDSLLHNDVQWKSSMHGAEAFIVVSAVSILLRMYIPLLFWSVHVFMDWVQVSYWNIVAWPEVFFMALLGGVILYMELRIYHDSVREDLRSPSNYIRFLWIRTIRFWSDVFPLERIPQGCRDALEIEKGWRQSRLHSIRPGGKGKPPRP
ncbi:MAG: hypothetical protein WCY65_01325 [Candidatus Methanomethylophilaceae archaeon]